MLECPVCKLQLSKIDSQHLKKHSLSKEEYFARFGESAPFGYSEELKKKKSGSNHPLFGKKRSDTQRSNISSGVKKMWETYEPSEKQKEHARQMGINAQGDSINLNRHHDSRSDTHKQSLSTALLAYHKTRKGSYWWNLANKLSTWASFDYPETRDPIVITCNTCGSQTTVVYETLARHDYQNTLCKSCNPVDKSTSKLEQELAVFIRDDLGLVVSQNNKSILGTAGELDVFIPSLNIGVEFHGIYWHSSLNLKDKWRHRRKFEKAKELGIRLIQIFEDEWVFKKQIVKDRLRSILTNSGKSIGARSLSIKEITAEAAKDFLEKHHLQGNVNAALRVALLNKENEIIQLMTFGKPRRAMSHTSQKSPDTLELVRYAINPGFKVTGGSAKIIKYVQEKFPNAIIESWADLRWVDPNKNVYSNLGFSLISDSKLGYFYTDHIKRFHRYGFRKPKDCPKELTEEQYWANKKMFRIYDCGQYLYSLSPKTINTSTIISN